MTKEASVNGLDLRILEAVPGKTPDLFKSALLAIEG